MFRYFEKRVSRKEFFAPLDELDEGTSENGSTMGASKQLERLKGFLHPLPTTATIKKTPDNSSSHDAPEPSCMQLSLSVLSMTDNSSPTISARQLSIASLEAEVVSPCDLSRRSSMFSVENLLGDLKEIQDEDAGSETKDTGCETKKHKKKDKQKSKKQITSKDPYQASTYHHHEQDQDRARPRRAGSTGSRANELLRKVPKIPPSPAEQRKRSRSLPQKTPRAQNVVNHRRGTMDMDKTGRDPVAVQEYRNELESWASRYEAWTRPVSTGSTTNATLWGVPTSFPASPEHKKKKKSSMKQITTTDPYEASKCHHHGHNQDRARPRRAGSTGSRANEPLRKFPKISPSPDEQRKRSRSLPQKTPRAQNVETRRRGTMVMNKTTANEPLWEVPTSFPSPAEHKKKKKSSMKQMTRIDPYEASTCHHHGHNQDRARPRRAGSTGSRSNEPLRKFPKISPSPAEQRKGRRSLPHAPPRAQNVETRRRRTTDMNKTGRDLVAVHEHRNEHESWASHYEAWTPPRSDGTS